LTGALHVLYLQLLPLTTSIILSSNSKVETFWYGLTQVHQKNYYYNGEIIKRMMRHVPADVKHCISNQEKLLFKRYITMLTKHDRLNQTNQKTDRQNLI